MSDEKEFTIWSEGFAATGERGTARKMGTAKGATFLDAVANLRDRLEREKPVEYGVGCFRIEEDKAYYWGCRLFDNERAARRNFG